MGRKNSGGGGFSIPGTPLPSDYMPQSRSAAPNPLFRGSGGADSKAPSHSFSQPSSRNSSRYSTLYSNMIASVAQQAAKGFGAGAAGGVVAPQVFSPLTAAGMAYAMGKKEYDKIKSESAGTSGAPKITPDKVKRGGVFGSLLGDDDDDDTLGGGSFGDRQSSPGGIGGV